LLGIDVVSLILHPGDDFDPFFDEGRDITAQNGGASTGGWIHLHVHLVTLCHHWKKMAEIRLGVIKIFEWKKSSDFLGKVLNSIFGPDRA